jgi:hypothetical protein
MISRPSSDDLGSLQLPQQSRCRKAGLRFAPDRCGVAARRACPVRPRHRQRRHSPPSRGRRPQDSDTGNVSTRLRRITSSGSRPRITPMRCISRSSAKYTCGPPNPRTSPLGVLLVSTTRLRILKCLTLRPPPAASSSSVREESLSTAAKSNSTPDAGAE